ncbi:MAG TPA: efflux RND transporter periplasmic adaptor subunit [Verrucomicrobiae bacterium]
MKRIVADDGWFSTAWRPAGVSVLVAGVVVLAGCGKGHPGHTAAQADLPSAKVRTQIVESKPLTAVEEVVGTVRARLRATIEAKTSGRIAEMPVVLGQKISAGQLLARLDAPEIKARVEQAEAALQQAERDWKRVSSLFKEQAATRAESETAESRYQVAKGALAEARALLGYVEVVAPFDGVVTRKWVDVGDLAAPGKPLVDMEDPSRLQLEADVPEGIATHIKAAATMTIRVGQATPELAGTVAEMSPIADPVSRTFRVKLDLANPPGLMSGQFARLIVPMGETTSLRIPSSAVVQRGQMEIVFAVENQRARLHLVKTGRRVNDETEVLSGLDPGDAVVTDNAGGLLDGQRVEAK